MSNIELPVENQRFLKRKYAWKGKIKAGGVLFYDDVGIWILKERSNSRNNNYYYADPGGKYDYRDCSIINTICREFNEETYYAYNLETKVIQDNFHNSVHVCDDSYLCVIVYSTNPFDLSKFCLAMTQTLNENQHVPITYYSTIDFFRLPYENITMLYEKMCPRLQQIIHKSSILKNIPNMRRFD